FQRTRARQRDRDHLLDAAGPRGHHHDLDVFPPHPIYSPYTWTLDSLGIPPMKAPPAIAFVRVSSKKQEDGHGPERQIEGALNYAKLKGLPLTEDRIILDIGRSAFTGAHISKGKFGLLLKEVEAGKYPVGTALIVESVDRLSRQGIRESQKSWTPSSMPGS